MFISLIDSLGLALKRVLGLTLFLYFSWQAKAIIAALSPHNSMGG